jgi:hypothetical protein
VSEDRPTLIFYFTAAANLFRCSKRLSSAVFHRMTATRSSGNAEGGSGARARRRREGDVGGFGLLIYSARAFMTEWASRRPPVLRVGHELSLRATHSFRQQNRGEQPNGLARNKDLARCYELTITMPRISNWRFGEKLRLGTTDEALRHAAGQAGVELM